LATLTNIILLVYTFIVAICPDVQNPPLRFSQCRSNRNRGGLHGDIDRSTIDLRTQFRSRPYPRVDAELELRHPSMQPGAVQTGRWGRVSQCDDVISNGVSAILYRFAVGSLQGRVRPQLCLGPDVGWGVWSQPLKGRRESFTTSDEFQIRIVSDGRDARLQPSSYCDE
jgi:hypothetical protein